MITKEEVNKLVAKFEIRSGERPDMLDERENFIFQELLDNGCLIESEAEKRYVLCDKNVNPQYIKFKMYKAKPKKIDELYK